MHPRPAFALTDLLASVAGLAVLLSVSAATLADNGTVRQKQQNMTQLRGIHQGLVTFANSNREKFPGLDSRGRTLANSEDDTGNSGDGLTTEARLWILLNGDFFIPEYAIAPIENRALPYDTDADGVVPVTYENYSYALLDIAEDANNRRAEWSQTLNTQSIVVSDRNCSDINEQDPFSIWNDDEWHGSALWNDNHISFESTHVFETRYGSGELNIDRATGTGTDALFTLDTQTGDEALMTFSKDEDGNERVIWDIDAPEEDN